MEILVKIKLTNEFSLIEDTDFKENLHINYDNSIYHVSENYQKLGKNKAELKSKLSAITDNLGGFEQLREHDKLIIARNFATNQTNIDLLLSKDEQINIIASSYDVILQDNSHRSNGKNYFNQFRASLVYDFRHGIYTDVEIFTIETKLNAVITKLVSGDWMSARALLFGLDTNTLFTETMKNNLMTDFSNYIQNHY